MRNSILASSVSPLPEPRLEGYAILGSDFVIGDAGQSLYGHVPTGGDGAYISVQTSSAGHVRIGTDDAGYRRLYMYRHDSHWAVGTSLIEVAEHAAGLKWPLSIDAAQIQSFMLGRWHRKPHLLTPGMISQQATSRKTAFKEIFLLLPDEEVVASPATPNEARIERRPREKTPDTYGVALQEGVNELVGRMRTLLSSQVPLRSDITGGRDSRVILAALTRAKSSGINLGERVLFRSGEHVEADWRIVEPLARKYHLEVNRRIPGLIQRVDPDAGYAEWRRYDLGGYAPVYPVVNYDLAVSLTGAAGGAHRSVYRNKPLKSNVVEQSHRFLESATLNEIARSAKETVDHAGYALDDNLAHFRLFRNRFHGGRNALRSLSVAPLSSTKLQGASNLMSAAHLGRAQFFADVMFNLHPGLAAEPYDSPSKEWDERHVAELTTICINDSQEGAVYGAIEQKGLKWSGRDRNALDPYREAFDAIAGDVISSGLLPSEYVYGAGFELHNVGAGRFDHAIDGAPASTVLLAGEALNLVNN